MNAPAVPSKATIQGSYRSESTLRTYKTYQKQFIDYCNQLPGVDPHTASPSVCTDFFHHLYSLGKTARTVISAKTALVAYFHDLNVEPNPARAFESKQYVVGLQKYNKRNNIDDENKAHPLTVFELSCLENSFSTCHIFVDAMYRFLFSASYLGCFRISEMLNLSWDDVSLMRDGDSQYVSIRLRWHKKASVQSDCQVYHLVDEKSFPCLRVCGLFADYVGLVKRASPNLSTKAVVFPAHTIEANGVPKLNWYKPLDQNQVRLYLKDAVQKSSELPTGITLHSMRRGGSFYRVFESPERRFNFRDLMAWCRWEDVKTCCEYLITRSISNEIDPRNLLRVNSASQATNVNAIDTQELCSTIIKGLLATGTNVPSASSTNKHTAISAAKALPTKIAAKPQRQTTLDVIVSHATIPTARSAKDA